MKTFIIIVLLVFSTSTSTSLAGTSRKNKKDYVCYRLYHWSNSKKIKQMAQRAKRNKNKLLKTINNKFFFAIANNQFRSKPVLFTWNDPVTGIMSDPEREVYCWGEDSERDLPVLMQLDLTVPKKRFRKFKTRKLVNNPSDSQNRYQSDQPNTKASECDLVFHQFSSGQGDCKYLLKEFIVTNGKVIDGFTADVDKLKPIVEKERDKILNDPNYHYKLRNCHVNTNLFNNNQKLREEVVPWLNKYLEKTSNKDIPKSFR